MWFALSEGMHYTTAEHFSRNLQPSLAVPVSSPLSLTNRPSRSTRRARPTGLCSRVVKRIGPFGRHRYSGRRAGERHRTAKASITPISPHGWTAFTSADIVMEQYDYYGTYQGGFINSLFGQKNVTVTTAGYNYIAPNDDVYVYTGVTSAGSDESNIGFILTNQRTKQTTFYSIAGAEEFSAMNSAEAVQHLNYTSTFPLLLNISNQPTYFMALKDYAGLVKMYAMVNVQQYQIVATGTSVEECQANYYKLLRQNKLDTGEEPVLPADEETVVGTVVALRSAVIDGTTMYYVTLDGGNTVHSISAGELEKVILLNVGDYIGITYEPSSLRDDRICTANDFEWVAAEKPVEPTEELEQPEAEDNTEAA